MSESAVLERVAVEDTSVLPSWGKTPKQAKEVLGYMPLWKKEKYLELMAVLANSGSLPFTDASVERYRQDKLKENFFWSYCLWRLGQAVFAISVFVLMLCFGPVFLVWIISLEIWYLFLITSLGFGLMAWGLGGLSWKVSGSWDTVPLIRYHEEVPVEVLNLAVRIGKALPGVFFHVDRFVEEEVTLDPFLVVYYGGERYYIAVWKEPSFFPGQLGEISDN